MSRGKKLIMNLSEIKAGDILLRGNKPVRVIRVCHDGTVSIQYVQSGNHMYSNPKMLKPLTDFSILMPS